MYGYLKYSFFGKQKNLITICLPWGCEKLPVETKRATVKSHLSSIIMAAWNWVLEPFENIVLQKKVPYQNTYWFVEYGTSESSEWYQIGPKWVLVNSMLSSRSICYCT